jgi:hypothetical protein
MHRLAAAVMLKEAAAIDPRFDRGVAELRRSAYTHFAARFRRFQELGMVRSSLSADIVAHLQVGMFEELVKAFVLGDDDPDLDGLAEQMADFEWNGVRGGALRTKEEGYMRSLVCGIGFARVVGSGGGGANRAGFFRAACQVGDEIVVTSAEGVEIGGRVTKISPSALSIDGYAFTPADAIKIERPGDSLEWRRDRLRRRRSFRHDHRRRGVPARHVALCERRRRRLRLLGALIDFAHQGRRTIYRSPSAAPRKAMRLVPDIGRERKGVAVALAF